MARYLFSASAGLFMVTYRLPPISQRTISRRIRAGSPSGRLALHSFSISSRRASFSSGLFFSFSAAAISCCSLFTVSFNIVFDLSHFFSGSFGQELFRVHDKPLMIPFTDHLFPVGNGHMEHKASFIHLSQLAFTGNGASHQCGSPMSDLQHGSHRLAAFFHILF